MTTIAIMLIAVTSALAQNRDDFKSRFLAANPNGEWTFGFLNEKGSFVPYNTTFDDGDGVVGWCLDKCPGVFGEVTVNFGEEPIDRYGIRWESGQMCVNPGIGGRSAIVRWTAPNAASVRIGTLLTGQCETGGSAGFSVRRNGASLFSDTVDGFVGSGSGLVGRKGQKSETSCLLATTVEAGATIDFIVTIKGDNNSGLVGFAAVVETTSKDGVRSSSASPVPISSEKMSKLMPEKVK